MKTDGSLPICSSFLKSLTSQIKPCVEPIELAVETNQNKRNQPNPQPNLNLKHPRTPPKLHHFMLRSLSTAIQWQCPGRFLLTRPRHPDLPCSSLKRVLSSFSISARCSSRVSLPAGMAAAADPALPPRRDSQCGEGEASPAVREHTQNPRVSGDPRHDAPAPERLTPPAALTCSPVPGERGDTAPQGRAEGRRARDELGTGRAVRQRPALPRPGTAAGAPRSSSRPTARPGPQPEPQGCPRGGEA